ncbi:formin-like protein 5 [Leopardus geoffroyi]|uniref:formin-like protein 5 n=1 Tax=Leopardus geoffroyi TaxID=46844 RepID=UPI001E25F238|nr:formin-like protein 5 [Leopardus geoffroyi]
MIAGECASFRQKQKQNSPSANLERARRHQVGQTLESFPSAETTREKGGTAPRGAPSGFGRKPAAGCGCPLPSSEERRLHNFVRERLAPAAPPPPPPPPPPACPFVGEQRRRQKREGARRRPPGKRARGRAPRGRPSPGGGGRALPLTPGPRPSALGRRPPPPQAQQLCSERAAPLGSGSAPARPRRPPRAGLRERGAPGHLTARPVNQLPPRAPSPPAAAGPALGWPGAARPARLPERAARRELGMDASRSTIPFIQITRTCESRPHLGQTG